MTVYVIYAAGFTLMLFFFTKRKSIFIPVLLLFVLNAIRSYSVGTDYLNYLASYPPSDSLASFFNSLSFNTFLENIGRDKSVEIGWALLTYLGGNYSMPFYMINLIAVSVILFFTTGMIYKQSPHFYFSIYLFLMLYLFYPSFNIMRQSVSIAIFGYSIRYINEKKPIFYLAFCILALMFHSSAILLPLLYLFRYVRLSSVVSIVILVLSLIIPIMGWDKTLLTFLINEKTLQVYQGYVEDIDYSSRNIMGNIYKLFPAIVQSMVFMYCAIRMKGSRNIYMILWFAGILILNITSDFVYLYRISGYFQIAQIIALPMVVYGSEPAAKMDRLSYLVILAYGALIYSYKLYSEFDGIVPYTTIFN